MLTNMDKLYESVAANGPVCVGLDTEISYLPTTDTAKTAGENVVAFNRALIDATKGVAGCYKVQIAYYESLGLDGMRAYAETLKLARATGLPVIADIKRGDIAKTAEMYAKAHFTGDFEADIITLAPYMGLDSISPYLPYCAEQGKGVFVLCRTSNPGAKDFEYKKLDDGRHVYDLVGDSLTALGKDYMGEHGYSSIGLVIGGTHTEEATAIRAAYKDTFFLIPGYGARPAPTGLRAWLVEAREPRQADHGQGGEEDVMQLECHLDHLTGEELGTALEQLAAAADVLDVLWLPGTGKKNRPAGLLRVLCRPADTENVARAVLRHTHTLGLRRQLLQRLVLPRRATTCACGGASLPAKEYELEGRVYVRPEADAVARQAAALGLGAPALRFGRK